MNRRAPPLLLFDGECGFCTMLVGWLQARFVVAVDVVPWQCVDFARLGLTRRQVEHFVWWLDATGAHRGHRAAARALLACRSPWPRVGRLLAEPLLSPFAALGYRAVSALRHWLPGVRPALSPS